MSNILITSVGRRVSLVRFFKTELKNLFPASKVFVTDSNPKLSAAAQVADKAFKICEIKNDAYISSLLNICKENNISLIIPTIDNELLKLAKNLDVFRANSIEVVISDSAFISLCESKIESQYLFKNIGVKTPKTYSKNNFKLPLYIKPDKGSSTINNYVIKEKSQLCDYYFDNKELIFFEYINKADFDEYTCDIYFDKLSEIKCIIPRKRIEVRGGEVSKSVTVRNLLIELFKENAKKFQGVRGCINVQFFMHKKTQELFGIEFNPRFGGGFPLSYLAGGNYPKWIIQEYLFNKKINYFDYWEDKLLMLRYDDEILVHNYED